MNDCIFCKIVSGQAPCYKVYEDKDFLGFLDIRPLNFGHCLMIPKKHYRWVYEVPNYSEYWEAVKKLALSVKKATQATSINFLISGEEIDHAHIWIIPRFYNDGGVLRLINIKKFSEEEMKSIAAKICNSF